MRTIKPKPANRRCERCRKILSIYNKKDKCNDCQAKEELERALKRVSKEWCFEKGIDVLELAETNGLRL